jgi:hypothetical protein
MNERSRLSQIRRNLLEELKEEVKFYLGPIPPSLRRYYLRYKDEFTGRWRSSSKNELIREVQKARIVMLGDYHTLRQSQRTTLRILREVVPGKRRVRLCLEMVHSAHQNLLDRFLAGGIGPSEFLRAVNYDTTWGFPWAGYCEILEFASRNAIPVHGLNVAGSGSGAGLHKRDRHAGGLLADLAVRHPDDLIHVVFGDLHLASEHLPRETVAALRRAGVENVEPLVIFQNSETIFWRMHRRRLQQKGDVVQLGRNRYCVNSTPPWVKLHSAIFWERNRDELLERLLGDGTGGGDGSADTVEYSEQQASMIRLVAGYFGLDPPGMDDFTVLTLVDLEQVISSLSRLPRFPSLQPLLLARESLFIPERRIIFLRGPDMHYAAEQAAVFLHWLCTGYRPRPDGGQNEFYCRVIRNALGFLGSLVINPRRKHWHEQDHLLFRARQARRRNLTARGRVQREASGWVLSHLRREGNRRHGPLLLRSALEIDNRCLRLVSAGLGQILGYRLYHGMLQGAVSRSDAAGLFSRALSGRHEARELYLALQRRLHRVVPVVISKSHSF